MEKGYHKLKIIAEIKKFILIIYQITDIFPKSEEFGLKSQLRRAAISVLLNTVEGHRKKSDREFFRFLETADCSLTECEVALEMSRDLYFLSEKNYSMVEVQRKIVASMLVNFMKTVSKSYKK